MLKISCSHGTIFAYFKESNFVNVIMMIKYNKDSSTLLFKPKDIETAKISIEHM